MCHTWWETVKAEIRPFPLRWQLSNVPFCNQGDRQNLALRLSPHCHEFWLSNFCLISSFHYIFARSLFKHKNVVRVMKSQAHFTCDFMGYVSSWHDFHKGSDAKYKDTTLHFSVHNYPSVCLMMYHPRLFPPHLTTRANVFCRRGVLLEPHCAIEVRTIATNSLAGLRLRWLAVLGVETGLTSYLVICYCYNSRQQRRENFRLQSWLCVLTLIRCPFHPLCYHSST